MGWFVLGSSSCVGKPFLSPRVGHRTFPTSYCVAYYILLCNRRHGSRAKRAIGLLYSLYCREGVFSETGLPLHPYSQLVQSTQVNDVDLAS